MLAVILRGKKKGIEKETLFFVREILKKREKLEDFHTLCQEMQLNDTLIPPPSPLTPPTPPRPKKKKERKEESFICNFKGKINPCSKTDGLNMPALNMRLTCT